jgi:uncharacterized SAM-binding protein YcdF (DUF218 family)
MLLATFQFVDSLIQPIGFLWVLMVGATGLLLWKRRWRMALLPGLMVVFFWIIGASSWPFLLLAGLERPYRGTVLSTVPPGDAVVMLGGTHRRSPNDAFGLDLTPCADRVVMAVELVRLGKGRALVLGGSQYWNGHESRPDSELLQHWLQAWQLPGAPIFSLGINASTYEEAVHTRALMKEQGWHRVILVTSAFHMKRAEAVFATQGVPVVCVACDFQASPGESAPDQHGIGFDLIPRIEGFQALGLYLHEQAGWLQYRSRGWISAVRPENPAEPAPPAKPEGPAGKSPEISGEDRVRK